MHSNHRWKPPKSDHYYHTSANRATRSIGNGVKKGALKRDRTVVKQVYLASVKPNRNPKRSTIMKLH